MYMYSFPQELNSKAVQFHHFHLFFTCIVSEQDFIREDLPCHEILIRDIYSKSILTSGHCSSKDPNLEDDVLVKVGLFNLKRNMQKYLH